MSNLADFAAKTVIFATDLSEKTTRPLNCAVEIASSLSARLLLVHVLTPQEINLMEYASSEVREQVEYARKELEIISQSVLATKHIPSEIIVRHGEIRDVIFEIRRQYEADLIIVGSSGEKVGKGKTLGSTAEAIFRSASCSVVAIGPKVKANNCAHKIESILFPVDFASITSSSAVPGAASLSRKFSADLFLLHVYQDSDIETICCCNEKMDNAVSLARQQWPRVDGLLVKGSVSSSIVSCAKERGIDLIAMTVRQGDLEDGTRLDGFISDIIREATCPVLSLMPTA